LFERGDDWASSVLNSKAVDWRKTVFD
jgi:hypothetical protein